MGPYPSWEPPGAFLKFQPIKSEKCPTSADQGWMALDGPSHQSTKAGRHHEKSQGIMDAL